MKLSAAGQHLMDFAKGEFGGRLTEFLLAGLGENATAQKWRFTITYSSDDSVLLKRRVDVITYEPLNGTSYLPRWRDPIVLIAFLHLLLRGDQKSQNNLRYNQKDILNSLEWKDTQKARREIDEAVNRYSLLTYQWKMNKSELNSRNLKFYTVSESLISGYEILDSQVGGAKGMNRVLNQIVFNEHFIRQLLSQSLFGIDWNSVHTIQH
jgi:hypothetical protein